MKEPLDMKLIWRGGASFERAVTKRRAMRNTKCPAISFVCLRMMDLLGAEGEGAEKRSSILYSVLVLFRRK